MNDEIEYTHDELKYLEGSRAAYTHLLRHILGELGYAELKEERLALVLAETVAALRIVCEEFGDNDWPDNLHPADVIEKHLLRHLRADQ